MNFFTRPGALLLFLSATMIQAQSGWVREQGKAFAKSDLVFFRGSTYYNPEEVALTTAAFTQATWHFYGEYGLGHRMALQVYLPLLRWNQFATTSPAIGQGDLRLEWKWAILQGKTPLSLAIAPEIPTGRAMAFAQNKDIPGDGIFLPTGDGEFNLWTTLAVSRSFGRFYGSAFAAFNLRTRYQGLAFRHQVQAGAEWGGKITPQLWFQLKARIQESLGTSRHPELGFVRGDATAYTGASLGLWYELNSKWGIAAEAGGFIPGVVPFRNLYTAPSFSAGATWQVQ